MKGIVFNILFLLTFINAFEDNYDYDSYDGDFGEKVKDSNYLLRAYNGNDQGYNKNHLNDYYDKDAIIFPDDDYSNENEIPPPFTTYSNTPFSHNLKRKNGPLYWSNFAPACDGAYQSPINIETRSTSTPRPYQKLQISKWNEVPETIEISNEGYTIKIKFEFQGNSPPVLRGGPLTNEHNFVDLHYHFGASRRSGSEHRIDNKIFNAEAHLIFYNTKYDSFETASRKSDGLVVLSRLYKLWDLKLDNYGFYPYLKEITNFPSAYSVDEKFSLQSIIGPLDFNFYSYKGSLTTPPCSEVVTWIVSETVMPINSNELERFRQCTNVEGISIAPNFRPIQRRNNRKINYYHN